MITANNHFSQTDLMQILIHNSVSEHLRLVFSDYTVVNVGS